MPTLTLTCPDSPSDANLNNAQGGYSHTLTTMLVGGADPVAFPNYGQGFRFTGVTLGPNDTINDVALSLLKSTAQWNDIPYRWVFIDQDDTAVFSSGSPPGSRAIGAVIVVEQLSINRADAVRVSFPNTLGNKQTLATGLAAVLDRAGWVSGNAVALVNNSDQDASANTGNSYNAYHTWDSATASSEPQLVINYTAGAAPSANPGLNYYRSRNRVV